MFCNRDTKRPDAQAAAPAPAEAPRRQARHAPVHLLLLGLSVLLPLALFGWTAWSERGQVLEEVEQSAGRTVAVLHEHAARVLETNELVLSEVMRQTGSRGWEEIAQDSRLWTYLLRVAADLGQPTDIVLADAEGRVRMTTTRFPAARGDSLAGHEDFEVLRSRQGWTHIGLLPEAATTPRQITLSRRRIAADGRFDGIVRVAVPVSQFSAFWARYAPNIRYIVTLARSDGRMIIRWPGARFPEQIPTDGTFLRHAVAQREGYFAGRSGIDGVERLSAFAQARDYPLHLAFSIASAAVLDAWRDRMTLLGLYTALAAAALLGMALMASAAVP